MPKRMIDREALVDHAYRIAQEEGLSQLSVRKLASACGIAVGSVYTHFPSKTDLTNAVIGHHFTEAVVADFCHMRPGEGFVAYLRRLEGAMHKVLATYRRTWLEEIQRLPYEERLIGHQAEARHFAHISIGLLQVLAADPQVDRSRLVGPLSPEALCDMVTDHLIAALRQGSSSQTLIALIENALYPVATTSGNAPTGANTSRHTGTAIHSAEGVQR
ncbi:TetR/AcrR family transcriptional regulator [Schaalia sp. 19OD2882]|uniref:TetR/AcrR family transcriptional regulator n=1 Tax=Schaalia sp. 19OD2882 TaxID=2794089 RepID=UPI001C1ECF70|nr:TetR/AcrR family transcriptional regulator [Schaalia sp. 19OD2882]QWW20037.1 TetR/AcrR family transcriptional regulator [Schaalia sp. 19OD2882]